MTYPHGQVRAVELTADRERRPLTPWRPNLVLREWGAAVARLLLREGLEYGLSAMYIEFANSATPVTPPAFDREPPSGQAYYTSLATDPVRDYLRVPIAAGSVSSSQPTQYPKGNRLTVFAITSHDQGVHGKPFSDAASSRVIGAALVATPVANDPTQDIVVSRFYFPVTEQVPKLATSQIGIEWALTFE